MANKNIGMSDIYLLNPDFSLRLYSSSVDRFFSPLLHDFYLEGILVDFIVVVSVPQGPADDAVRASFAAPAHRTSRAVRHLPRPFSTRTSVMFAFFDSAHFFLLS